VLGHLDGFDVVDMEPLGRRLGDARVGPGSDVGVCAAVELDA
jgi:hypothetical protein